MANTVTDVVKVAIIPGQIIEGNSIVDSNSEVIISYPIETPIVPSNASQLIITA